MLKMLIMIIITHMMNSFTCINLIDTFLAFNLTPAICDTVEVHAMSQAVMNNMHPVIRFAM